MASSTSTFAAALEASSAADLAASAAVLFACALSAAILASYATFFAATATSLSAYVAPTAIALSGATFAAASARVKTSLAVFAAK